MKLFGLLVLCLMTAVPAFAEPFTANCAVGDYECVPFPDGTKKCGWVYDLGYSVNLDLQKSASHKDYDVYRGQWNGKTREGYDYVLTVFQRRQGAAKQNYYELNINVDGINVIADGENAAEARYVDAAKEFGVGVHCSTDQLASVTK